MNVDIKFFKEIYNEDIIYHYTKASTAIDFILFNGQLRFNKRQKSKDPIEKSKARRGTVYTGFDADKPSTKKTITDSNSLLKFSSNMENQFRQISFCKNNMGHDFANENYISNFNGHEELFGFTKLRMWEQYADNYLGVCIAFSKNDVLSLNSTNTIIPGDISYLTFRELTDKKQGDINNNHLLNVGKDLYKEQIDNVVKQSFFYKHNDYSGENEFRIGILDDKNIMLDVTGCIKAIFMSNYLNARQKNDLHTYAKNLDVPLIEMNWKHDSFEPIDYIKQTEFIEKYITKKQ